MQTLIDSKKTPVKIIKLKIQLWDIFMCLAFDTATAVNADIISSSSVYNFFMCAVSVPLITDCIDFD